MREILFRGRTVEGEEWVVGFFAVYSLTPFIGAPNSYGTMLWFEVDPETVGQFTGLTDKNGKKIFEGDIVQAHFRNNRSKQIFRVVFDDGMFLFDNNHVKVPKYEIYSMKVIGNIHDNVDLVEGWEK